MEECEVSPSSYGVSGDPSESGRPDSKPSSVGGTNDSFHREVTTIPPGTTSTVTIGLSFLLSCLFF